VVSTYFRLTDDLRVPPENLVVAGDSAGGALGLALLLYLRDNGYTLPGGAILFSPWVGMWRLMHFSVGI
jgi:acetyl esterase/lipase